MKFENEHHEMEDVQVETALRHFRESIHGWSEHEFAKPRAVPASQRSGLWSMRNRVAAWGLASLLVISAVTVPVDVHYRHQQQRIAAQRAAGESQRKHDEELRQMAMAMTDEELMRHLDSDVSQATPDAMEPLASLMYDSTASSKAIR
jgi:hypothetical protein